MQAAEAVGVLPFVFLNSELCELKGEAVIITQGNCRLVILIILPYLCCFRLRESLFIV